VEDLRTFRGATADSDHFLLVAKVKLHLKRRKVTFPCAKPLALNRLEDSKVEEALATSFKEKYAHAGPHTSTESIWESGKKALLEAASQEVGMRNRARKPWITPEADQAIEDKRKAHLAFLHCPNQANREEYKLQRHRVTKAIRASKQKCLDNTACELEEAAKKHEARRVFEVVCLLQRKPSTAAYCLTSKDGQRLTCASKKRERF